MTIELKNGRLVAFEKITRISLIYGRPIYVLEDGTKVEFTEVDGSSFVSYINDYESAVWSAVVNKYTGELYGFVRREVEFPKTIYVRRDFKEVRYDR